MDDGVDPNIKTKQDINYNRNYKAWRDFVMEKLDQERTFAGVEDQEEFMQFVYNSLVRNQYLKSDGADFTYGSRSTARGTDVAKAAGLSAKRVYILKLLTIGLIIMIYLA